MHINLHFTNINIYNDGWLIYGLILPLVLGGISRLPISDNASNNDVEFDIESDMEFDVEYKKPLYQIIGLPSNLYNLSL
jgi:hypothetical protein